MLAALIAVLVLLSSTMTTHAQTAGRPILTIRNYSVNPSPVRAGQTFTLTIEVYNNGSRAGENTMAVFSGGDFLPVGQTGHMLWQLHINHTATVTQQMRAPTTLSTGVHQLKINLSANDYEGNHYDYPQTVPVEVVGASSGIVSGPPKVIIEGAETTPPILSPGTPFTLTLRLSNQGDRAAVNLFASCDAADMLVPTTGSDVAAVAKIAVGHATTVTLPLMLSWDVDRGGRQNVCIDLEYGDSGGNLYKDKQDIGVDIDASPSQSPHLIVESVRTLPDKLVPGQEITLTVCLANVGNEAARRIALSFGGQDGASLEPFLLLNAGNVAFVSELSAGATVEITRQLAVQDTADAKAYHLPLALDYEDGRGTHRTAAQQLSLIVQECPKLVPQLIVSGYQTTPSVLSPGDQFTLTMTIANVGSADALRLTMALGGVDGAALEPFLPVNTGNVRFIPNLQQGQAIEVSQCLIVDGAASTKAYNLPIALTYDGGSIKSETAIQRLSLIVRQRIELQVGIYSRPETIGVGAPSSLSLEVLNLGRSAVDILGLEATSEGIDIEADGVPFIGPLDPGGSAPLDVIVTPRQGGPQQLEVQAKIRNDLNQVQVASHLVTIDVADGPGGAPSPVVARETVEIEKELPETFWQTILRALKGFIGLGS
jgi:hypothetical protein